MDKKYKVYKYINKINGCVYIGATSLRLSQRSGKDGSSYKECPLFWNAIQTFGWDNFEREIIKDNLTKEESEYWERYYINLYNSCNIEYGYNIQKGGSHLNGDENNFYNKSHNDITKQAIKKANKNRVWTEESRNKISKKISGSNHPNAKKVICLETGVVYNTIVEAAKLTKLNASKICEVLHGNRKTTGGYHWALFNSECVTTIA